MQPSFHSSVAIKHSLAYESLQLGPVQIADSSIGLNSWQPVAVQTEPDVVCEEPGIVSLPLMLPSVQVYHCLLAEGQAVLAAQKARLRHSVDHSMLLMGAQHHSEQSDAVSSFDTPLLPQAKQKAGKKPKHRTRVKPSSDIVKLEDRLHYLLQPPLESLLEAHSLRFPFQPFPYQLEGVAFLMARKEALLADEMGLGKTMQAITTIRLLAKLGELRRVLLVCPKPVVTNWQREFALWAPELPVSLVEGGQAKRKWCWEQCATGVLIANYEAVVRDIDILRDQHEFDLVVIDEAQRIKNCSGATNAAIAELRCQRSWALTGTPIENSTDDLVGIFEFVSPHLLQTKMPAKVLSQAVSDHVLRRTKDDVELDLPPKLFRDATVSLTSSQLETYQRAEDDGVVRLNDMGDELTIQHVFELVLRLKQICNFDPATGESAKLDQMELDMEECAATGRKAIVFSQWVNTIDHLQQRLGRFNPLAYHGKIPSKQRDPVLQEFRENPDRHILLMSYGAGSVGLNLQFAGYVFLFDRWWNPAVEDQAINRAHRIGSSGPVTITRFLTVGTIEERIDQVLQEKRELFQSIFGDRWTGAKIGMSRQEVLGLLGLSSAKSKRKAA